ncbi:PerC family transcriptional regulator [Escherichia coli]|nr:PerC family transcriptional regulator [Escherichia coli]EEZ5175489.1 PerC family transcriptional regulator [Escherichia coli]EFA7760572.1 PerC family transcriptional regulator [Escherichia coli]EFA7762048.1 PerC family transcriptional regulator [Escherichia coli]EFA7784948.1 PerC family transcriptional regulator [Escherichia coli]
MITDSVAQKLEARGLWRRAATRWGEVLINAETDREREEAAKRRAICISKTRRMPEQLVTFGDVRKAADRTLKEMGINPQDEWRNYSFSDAGDDLALP